MLNYIRDKIYNIVKQHNIIDAEARIDPTVYVSGSSLFGNININNNSKIFQAHIEGKVDIGRYTSVWGPNIFIIGRVHGVQIGNFCSIARNVSIQEDGHNPNRITTYFLERNIFNSPLCDNASVSKGKVIIGNDVWIGAGAQILSGVTISDGAIVGAGAMITKDIPPYAIVVGNPARVIKYRFEQEKINHLLELQWWNWSIEKIRENKEYLLSVENKIGNEID